MAGQEIKLQRIFQNKFFRIFIFLLVFYVTFVLRAHNYEKVPTAYHLDELNYGLSGINLVETGIPMSWSTLEYPKRAEVYSGEINYKGGPPSAFVTLYRPWLDQPPLFSMIVGYSAHLGGADRNGFVPSSYTRIPTVFMAALTSIMIFLIARMISGYWLGILSLIVYGTVPLFVFASRSAMSENFIALLFSIIFYLLLKFLDSTKIRFILPIPILIGLAGLSKATGFFLLPFVLYIIFSHYFFKREKKSAVNSSIFMILGVVPFIVGFFAYGYLMDAEIFKRILEIQSARPVGFGSLAWYFTSPSFSTAIFNDSWFVFCMLSAAYFIFSTRFGFKKGESELYQILGERYSLVIFAFVYSVLVVMISGGERDLLSWYRFPSYPFLAIIGAWGIYLLVKKADFFATFIVAGMLLGNRSLLANDFRNNVVPANYRNIMGTLLLPSILRSIFEKKWLDRLSRSVLIGVVAVGVYINIVYIYNAYELTCESKTCPLVPTTRLSTLHFPIVWRALVLGEPDRR